jgi:hypothetical protein
MIGYILLGLAMAVAIFIAGRKSVGSVPEPEQKRFGLEQAEALAKEIPGGINPQMAKVAHVAAVVGGMVVTVTDEAKAEVGNRTAAANREKAKAKDFRSKADQADAVAASQLNRATVVAALAANFTS